MSTSRAMVPRLLLQLQLLQLLMLLLMLPCLGFLPLLLSCLGFLPFPCRPQVVTGSQHGLPLQAVKEVAATFGTVVGTSNLATKAQARKNGNRILATKGASSFARAVCSLFRCSLAR